MYCSHLTETCSYIDPRILLPTKAVFSSKHFLRSFVLLKHRLDEVDAYVCITRLDVFVVHLYVCVCILVLWCTCMCMYTCVMVYLYVYVYICTHFSCGVPVCVCTCKPVPLHVSVK